MATASTRAERGPRLVWILVGLLVLGVAIPVGIAIRREIVMWRAVALGDYVQEYGRVVYLFVEDKNRMPANEAELFSRAHLVMNPNGTMSPGPVVHGRFGPVLLGIWDEIEIPPSVHRSMGVAWGGTENTAIWMKTTISRSAAYFARRYSDAIKERLSSEASHPREEEPEGQIPK